MYRIRTSLNVIGRRAWLEIAKMAARERVVGSTVIRALHSIN
jgi:hypothetical protein